MDGWIKIHRKILEHWIIKNPHYFKAWIIMLITVNYEDKKCLIHGEILECKRGQSILSLDSWVKTFSNGWTKQKVRTFFELLKNDSMIELEGLRKTTRLTICNYDSYQVEQHTKNTQRTRKEHTCNTQVTSTKESKESKEEYIYNPFYDSEIEKSNNDVNYINFVKVLFGLNSLTKKLDRVLSMQEQVTFEQFKTIYNYKQKYNISIGDYLVSMENYKDLTKKNTVVQATLLNWIRRDKK